MSGAGETAAGSFPVESVRVMTKICREAESSLDYYALFKSILKEAPQPMSPLESLASSAVRTAHKARHPPPGTDTHSLRSKRIAG